MSDTKPRDLTAEELAILGSPASRGTESAPLRIPPGTQIAIELLDPAGGSTSAFASPAAAPNDLADSGGADTTKGTAPSKNPPRAKQHGRDRS